MSKAVFVPQPAILIPELNGLNWEDAREAFLERLEEAFEDQTFRRSCRAVQGDSILVGYASYALYNDTVFGFCDIVFCRREGKIVVYIVRRNTLLL